MSLLEFSRKEEAADFIAGIVSQMDHKISSSNIDKATEEILEIKKMYDIIEEEHGTGIAGAYVASYIAILLITLHEEGIGKIEIKPKKV